MRGGKLPLSFWRFCSVSWDVTNPKAENTRHGKSQWKWYFCTNYDLSSDFNIMWHPPTLPLISHCLIWALILSTNVIRTAWPLWLCGEDKSKLSSAEKEETNVEKWEVWQIISWTSSNEDDTAMWWSRLCFRWPATELLSRLNFPRGQFLSFQLANNSTSTEKKNDKKKQKRKSTMTSQLGEMYCSWEEWFVWKSFGLNAARHSTRF